MCATWKYIFFSLKAFFGLANRPFCPSGCQWEHGSSWGAKLTRRFICSPPQRCPEPRREPAGTPEEDRQCGSAAQGPSDAGAGGGVRSTLRALCATDLCGSHIPLLVGSGFWSVPASGALKKPKQRERIHFSSATPESCTTTRGDEEETRPPASHPRQWTAERCTTGSCSPSQSEVAVEKEEDYLTFFT